MKIGAHVSAEGGLSKALTRGSNIGCETIQIFPSSPQSWRFNPIRKSEKCRFRQNSVETGITLVYFHAIYLVNLGTQNPLNLKKSITSLINYLELASKIGATGVIFHPGSHGGLGFQTVYKQVVESIQQVLKNSPEGPYLCLENMAGMGHHIGADFEELGQLINEVNDPRLRICLDTHHAYAAGYDITTEPGVKDLIKIIDRAISIEKLAVVHANDSMQLCGSGVDRHDNIGEGFIGKPGFERIMGQKAFEQIPFLLEVPGFYGKGPDVQNIDILKNIRRELGLNP